MSFTVMLVVLFAALLHASWNALVKAGDDPFAESVLLTAGAGVLALAVLPFLPAPEAASWPYLAASVAIHSLYFYLVAYAYQHADLSFAYPLMRGTAPLITALLATALLGERLGGAWLGVVLLCAGVIGLALDQRRAPAIGARAWGFGLTNAAVIVAYTLVDGLGVRASNQAWSYVLWMFGLNALPMLAIGWLNHAGALAALPRRAWLRGLVTGGCSVGAYGLALWAMTQAPIALVAALRETSVLMGTAIAALVLKERFGRVRWLAAGLIAAGAAALKLL